MPSVLKAQSVLLCIPCVFIFFFQAEDGIRDSSVTGVQTCALPIYLEIREGNWYPEAETGPTVAVQAFAEKGRALQIPGPLIRVPEGTEVRATVRNALDRGMARLYGLHGRPGDAMGPLEIPAGESRDV